MFFSRKDAKIAKRPEPIGELGGLGERPNEPEILSINSLEEDHEQACNNLRSEAERLTQ
jgi:hypothetical protein